MFDIWVGDFNLTVLIILVSIAVILPGQLLLCFKVRPLGVRCAPSAVLLALTLAAFVMLKGSVGLDGLLFALLAIYFAFMLFVCGLAWAIWAITCLVRRKRFPTGSEGNGD